MKERITRFMQGRYGIDQFTNFLVFAALIMLIIEMFIKVPVIRFLFNVLSVAAIFILTSVYCQETTVRGLRKMKGI